MLYYLCVWPYILRHNHNMNRYEQFSQQELILRDELALDRTLLANERTLLTYLSAGLALVIAGVSMIHFSNGGWFMWVGIACVPCGIITPAIGPYRYRRMNDKIGAARRLFNTATSTARSHSHVHS